MKILFIKSALVYAAAFSIPISTLYAENSTESLVKSFNEAREIDSSLFSSFSDTKLLMRENQQVSKKIVKRMIPEIVALGKLVEQSAISIQMSDLSDKDKSLKIMELIARINIATERLASVTIGIGKMETMPEDEKEKARSAKLKTDKIGSGVIPE